MGRHLNMYVLLRVFLSVPLRGNTQPQGCPKQLKRNWQSELGGHLAPLAVHMYTHAHRLEVGVVLHLCIWAYVN